jgi:hypothetical protein
MKLWSIIALFATLSASAWSRDHHSTVVTQFSLGSIDRAINGRTYTLGLSSSELTRVNLLARSSHNRGEIKVLSVRYFNGQSSYELLSRSIMSGTNRLRPELSFSLSNLTELKEDLDCDGPCLELVLEAYRADDVRLILELESQSQPVYVTSVRGLPARVEQPAAPVPVPSPAPSPADDVIDLPRFTSPIIFDPNFQSACPGERGTCFALETGNLLKVETIQRHRDGSVTYFRPAVLQDARIHQLDMATRFCRLIGHQQLVNEDYNNSYNRDGAILLSYGGDIRVRESYSVVRSITCR